MKIRISSIAFVLFAVGSSAACASRHAGTHSSAPTVDAHGMVTVSRLEVPFSSFASAASRRRFETMLEQSRHAQAMQGIKALRKHYDRINTARVHRMRTMYAVHVRTTTMDGVAVDVVTPAGGIAASQRHRVLINLHGGAFLWGTHSGGLVESIPIASVGRIKVVSVHYRMAPEYHFPAASIDVETVYRALLKHYAARDIGIYGCSAGGVLTAESVARFIERKIPLPGAIGTFCGSVVDVGGDSAFVATALSGDTPPAPGFKPTDPATFFAEPYFRGADPDDPLVFPGHSPKLLKKFPPTLLITGTRDSTMSSMLQSQRLLDDAGVVTELHVWDGMWHSFFSDADLPESREAYRVIVHFFDRHLGRAPK